MISDPKDENKEEPFYILTDWPMDVRSDTKEWNKTRDTN